MQFLSVKKQASAMIFGHAYQLRPLDDPSATKKDLLVADDGSTSELLRNHKDILQNVTFNKNEIQGFPETFNIDKKLSPESIVLIIRAGGIGDHIMMTPAIRALRKELEYCRELKLWLAVQRDMFPVFENNPFIDKLFPLPIPFDDFMKTDYVIDFSDSIQNPDFNRLHLTDYFLNFFGLKHHAVADKSPYIASPSHDDSRIFNLLKSIKTRNHGKPMVLLQWEASARIRKFPPQNLAALTNHFQQFTFIVAHHPDDYETTQEEIVDNKMNVINMSHEMKSLYDFFSVLSYSDLAVTTDSSAYHIAAAYRKPTLVMFGPISSQLRTVYYSGALAINARYKGKTCKSPCGRHKGGCPEAHKLGTMYSPCLLSIKGDIVQAKFQKFIKEG